jgi:hypothetical protein
MGLNAATAAMARWQMDGIFMMEIGSLEGTFGRVIKFTVGDKSVS